MSREGRDLRYPWGLYAGVGGLTILGVFLLWTGTSARSACFHQPEACWSPSWGPDLVWTSGGLLLFLTLFLLVLYGWPRSSYWGTFWRPDPTPEVNGTRRMVDYLPFRRYWKKNDLRDMIGFLSFLTGALFLFTGLVMYLASQWLEGQGDPIATEVDTTFAFFALGLVFFIGALAALLIPIPSRPRP